MIYSGFKYCVEHPGHVPTFIAPEWATKLVWEHHQKLPQPLIEIDQEEWFRLGICSESSESESFYEGMNIPGEKEWFGGWACHIRMYYEYALVDAHLYCSTGQYGNNPELGKGISIPRDQYGAYAIRFFRLGCNHHMLPVPEESRMCWHVSRCSKCGMKIEIDSSD